MNVDMGKGLTFDMFVRAFTTNITEDMRKERLENMFAMLKNGENDDKGINVEDLKRLIKNVGESLCVSELQEMLARITQSGQYITIDEFAEIMCPTEPREEIYQTQ